VQFFLPRVVDRCQQLTRFDCGDENDLDLSPVSHRSRDVNVGWRRQDTHDKVHTLRFDAEQQDTSRIAYTLTTLSTSSFLKIPGHLSLSV